MWLHAASETQVIPGQQQETATTRQGAYDSQGSGTRTALAPQAQPVRASSSQQTAGQPVAPGQQLTTSLASDEQAAQPVPAPAALAPYPTPSAASNPSSSASGLASLVPGPSQQPQGSPLSQQSAGQYAGGVATPFGSPWEAIAAAQNQPWVDPVYSLGPNTSQLQPSWPAGSGQDLPGWQAEPLFFAPAGQPVQPPPTYGQLSAQPWPAEVQQQGMMGPSGQRMMYQQQPVELQWPGPAVDPESASRQRASALPVGLRLPASRVVSGWQAAQAVQQEQARIQLQDAPTPMQAQEQVPISSQPSTASIPEMGEHALSGILPKQPN